jgi:hypothetical protein
MLENSAWHRKLWGLEVSGISPDHIVLVATGPLASPLYILQVSDAIGFSSVCTKFQIPTNMVLRIVGSKYFECMCSSLRFAYKMEFNLVTSS